MKKQEEGFVVVVDAIVGRGHVYRRGQVLSAEQVGGYQEALIQAGGLQRVAQPATVADPLRNAVSLC